VITFKNERKEFEKGNKPWYEFAKDCIIGAYGKMDGQSIAHKERTILFNGKKVKTNKAADFAEVLEECGIIKINDLCVFEIMDHLRKKYA